MLVCRSVLPTLVVLLSVATCSLSGTEGEPGGPEILDRPEAVSGVGWDWEAPTDADVAVLPIPVGVAVLDGEGATALSGSTGEELWEYHEPGQNVFGHVSSNGSRLALHVEAPEEDTVRMLVLDAVTGDVLSDDPVDLGERTLTGLRDPSAPVRGALSTPAEDLWIVRDGHTVYARDLEQDSERWSASPGEDCEDEGSVGAMVVVGDVVVVSSTCHGGEEELYVENADFTSRLIALDIATGEELWRDAGRSGLYPAASVERDLTVLSSNLIAARTEVGESTQWVDPATGQSGAIEDGGLRWSDSEGDRLGVWNSAQRNYRIQDRDGKVDQSLREGGVSNSEMIANALRPDPDAYLAEGVLFLVDRVEPDSGEGLLAVFEGFGGAVEIAIDDGAVLALEETVLAPGAVAVPYTDEDGRSGVLGLL